MERPRARELAEQVRGQAEHLRARKLTTAAMVAHAWEHAAEPLAKLGTTW
jgi:hypothetical protein